MILNAQHDILSHFHLLSGGCVLAMFLTQMDHSKATEAYYIVVLVMYSAIVNM